MDKPENGTLLSPSANLQWKLLSQGAVIQWPISIEGQRFVVKSYYIPWIRNFEVQFSLNMGNKLCSIFIEHKQQMMYNDFLIFFIEYWKAIVFLYIFH